MSRKPLILAALALTLPLAALAQSGPYKVLKTAKVGGDGGFDYVTADSDGRNLYVARSGAARPHRRLQPRHPRPGRRHPRRQRPRRRRRHRHRPRLRHLQAHHHVRRQDLRRHQEDRRPGQSRRLPQRLRQPPLLRSSRTPRPTSPSSTTRTAPSSAPSTSAARPSRPHPTARASIYVDIEDKDAIAVIDANTMKMIGKYDISSKGGGCAGLALDAKNSILFAACRDKNNMIILSATDGHIITDLPTGVGCDGATFNPATMEAFSSQGDGTLTVIKENSPTSFAVEQTVTTPVARQDPHARHQDRPSPPDHRRVRRPPPAPAAARGRAGRAGRQRPSAGSRPGVVPVASVVPALRWFPDRSRSSRSASEPAEHVSSALERDMESLGSLITEARNPHSEHIDELSTLEMLTVINQEDATVAAAVASQLPAIATAVDAIAERFAQGGRLFYIGAGTSGRLGVLDASECPPTFSVPPALVQGLIAGGDSALRNSAEHAEDSPEEGARGSDQAAGFRHRQCRRSRPRPDPRRSGRHRRQRTHALRSRRAAPRPLARRIHHRPLLRRRLADLQDRRPRHHARHRPRGHHRLHPHEGRHRDQARPQHALHRRDDPHRRGLRQPDGQREADQRQADRPRPPHHHGRHRLRPLHRHPPAIEGGSVKVAIAMQKLSLPRAAAEERLASAGGKSHQSPARQR